MTRAIVSLKGLLLTAEITGTTGKYANGCRFDREQTQRIFDASVARHNNLDYFEVDGVFCFVVENCFGNSQVTPVAPGEDGLYAFRPGWIFRYLGKIVEPAPIAKPAQLSMFNDGSDLPLFSGTPMKADTSQFKPGVHVPQASFATCRVCMDTGRIAQTFCTCDAGQAARKNAASK